MRVIPSRSVRLNLLIKASVSSAVPQVSSGSLAKTRMHRQSLGKPGAKHLISGAAGGTRKEEKRKSIASAAGSAVAQAPAAEDMAIEADKLLRASSRADKSIHLIPVFTILCLLVLYFFSHEPSPTDMQAFGSSALRLDSRAAVSGAETGGHVGAERGNVALATHRSRRRLKAAAGPVRHRKIGSSWLCRAREDCSR
ncbi:unnamed protein product [Musa acuminata subsp. burmannicoides]